MSGTTELRTPRLVLRRYRQSDARDLFEKIGTDSSMYEYSGWNPYATREMAEKYVEESISNYTDMHFYGWLIECDGQFVGTIGAYDYNEGKNQIEIGMSIERSNWNRGFASEALKAVIKYLTVEEKIGTVVAWCAKENIGSHKALVKAGMALVSEEKNGLEIDGRFYDKLNFSYS